MEARSADKATARLLQAERAALSALKRLQNLEWTPEGTAAYIAAEIANEGLLDAPPEMPHGVAQCPVPRRWWWMRYQTWLCRCGQLYSLKWEPSFVNGVYQGVGWEWVPIAWTTLLDCRNGTLPRKVSP
jgi:hypothetical protein